MSTDHPAALRVATYNTRDFLDDPGAAARVVRALDPDVLCLQEAPRRLFPVTRISLFAGHCGLYWTAGSRGGGGTTILTSLRVQLLDVRHVRLPVPPGRRRRGYAVARVRLPGEPPLTVASVHLGLDADERLRHTRAVLAGLGAGPTLVAGDLNEGADGASWRLLAERLALVSPPGATFPAARPRQRLDVVFASPHVRSLPHRDVPLDDADLVAASDHRPVWVDVALEGQ